MTVQLRSLRHDTGRVAPKSKTETLMPDRAISVPRQGQTLRVISGMAWVTMGCKDYFLRPGDSLWMKPGNHDAVLEAMRRQPLVYEWL